MKKLFGFMLCLLMIVLCAAALADVPLDEAHFPDSNFLKCLNWRDSDKDGILSDAEIAAVDSIECNLCRIESLQGIEYFTSLTKLSCSMNDLTTLDLSHNTGLTSVDCSSNELTSLNISGCSALTVLECLRQRGWEISEEAL